MLLFAFGTCGMTYQWLTKELTHNSTIFMYGLTISSIMVIIALTTDQCNTYNNNWEYHAYKQIAIYTLVVCIISILYGIAVVVLSKLPSGNFQFGHKQRLVCTTILIILWIITACLTTFVGPFALKVDNGYISVWSSVTFSVLYLINTNKQNDE
jgi:hypothetical protein